jgi:Zn-dependent protease with chaperone function
MDDKERVLLKKFKYAVVSAGALLSFATALLPMSGGKYASGLEFALWALLPYIIFFAFSWRSDKTNSIVITGSLLFAMDLVAHFFIFFYIKAQVGVTVLVFTPVWLTVFVLPAGYLIGWLADRMAEKNEKPG